MWLLKYACGGSAVFWVRFPLGAAMDLSWWGRSSASPILWTLSTLHQSSRCSSRGCPQGGSTSSCTTVLPGPSFWVVKGSGRCPRACVSLPLPTSSTPSPPPNHLCQTPSPAKVLCRGSWVSVVGATVSKLAVISLLELFQARLSTVLWRLEARRRWQGPTCILRRWVHSEGTPRRVLMEAGLLLWHGLLSSLNPTAVCFGSRVRSGLGLGQVPAGLWSDVHYFSLFVSAECPVSFLLWLF